MDNPNTQPFYAGEKVIAVDAKPMAKIKNGEIYEVKDCTYESNGKGWWWYVHIVGVQDYLRPSIFRSLEKPELMVFEKINAEIPIHSN